MSDQADPADGQTLSFQLPRSFGDYELLEEIGRGGNGVVFKARQGVLNRFCAVKMLVGGKFARCEDEAVLRAEASAAASLDHPHIVGVYEAGVEDGLLFFSMEYVAGETLTQLVRTTMLPAERVARYGRDIARAIHYAHSRGVLHRDLKPNNIIIDQHDQPQITDFGLTKGVDDEDKATEGAGSPNFMAPEQASGGLGRTGVRTDVFGIGAILYFLLTDRPPFRGETLADTIDAVLHREPRRPREFRTGVSPDLETICLKCLEKRPSRRYASAAEVADELDRFLRNEPILARPVGPFERARRWCARHPALAGFAIATTVLLLTLAIGGPAMAYRIREQRDITRRNLYAADMALAFQALQTGGERQVREIVAGYVPAGVDVEDLRGWEWRYLAYRTRDRSRAVIGSFGVVPTVLRLIPRSGRCLVADFGGRLTLLDIPSATTLWTRTVRTNGSSQFVVSPDGRVAVATDREVGSTNTLLRFVDVGSGKISSEINVPEIVIPFAMTGASDVWVSARNDARRLSGRDGHVLEAIRFSTNITEHAVEFSPDARWLAAGLDDNSLYLMPVDSPGKAKIVRNIHNPASAIGVGATCVSFSPDSNLVATCGRDGTVAIWSVAAGGLVHRLNAHPDLVLAADFSEDGRHLVTAGRDARLCVWNVASGRLESEQQGPHTLVRFAAFLPGGNEFLTTGDDQTVRLWNAFPEAENLAYSALPAGTVAVGAMPDGIHYIWTRSDGSGGFSSMRTGKSVLPENDGFQMTGGAAMTSTGGKSLLARMSADGRVQLASLEKGIFQDWRLTNWITPGGGLGGAGIQMDISRDLRHLAIADPLNGVFVWSLPDLIPEAKFQAPGLNVIALDPSRDRIAYLGRIGRPKIRDLSGGREIEMGADVGLRQSAAFSPDGSLFLTAGLDGFVHVFNASSGSLIQRLASRVTGLISVNAFPDASRVVAGSVDGYVSVWDVRTGRELGLFSAHSKPVSGLEFLKNGTLVSAAADAIRFWPAPQPNEPRPPTKR